MKLIVSLNGSDGAGKTTQTDLIYNNNPGFVEKIGGLNEYYPFKQITDNDWWFKKSTAEEFCDVLYASISERNRDIERSIKPIILIDKGLFTFDARIQATLITKGLTAEESMELMNKYKKKYNIKDVEELNIFLNLSNNIAEQQKLIEERGKFDNLADDSKKEYKKYQLIQSEILQLQLSLGLYHQIDASDSIEIVNQNIMNVILNELKNKIVPLDKSKQIIAIGGLSESGKSSTGKMLMNNLNIPNFKFNYVNDNIKRRYNIDGDLFDNDEKIISILVIDEISNIFQRMYYWNMISFESLHNYKLTSNMKKIVPNNFNIVYLKTDKSKRINRNAYEMNIDIGDSKDIVDKKDNVKMKRGAAKIEQIADYVINNDYSVENLEKMIYNMISDINERSTKMKQRAGGLLIQDGKIALMHRIKEIDGVMQEYYVVPGGGIEEGESIEVATKREMFEEVGIGVELVGTEPKYQLTDEKSIQYFSLVQQTEGVFGTGQGPEFTSKEYANRGSYSIEMISLKDIIDGKVNLVPEKIKIELINDLMDIENIDNLSSKDLFGENFKVKKI